MRAQEQRQIEGIEEIQLLLRNVLQNQILDHLRQQVNKDIDDMIEQEIEEQVALQLEKHVPQALRTELADQKRRLAELQWALHNSESRRANAGLRSGDIQASLHTLYMSNGQISVLFPKDIATLLGLDGGTLKRLLRDYSIPDGMSDIREQNLNTFLQFIGVSYQVIWPTRKCEGEADVVVYPSRPTGSVRSI
ncbi:hypothetical protein SERLA73DRAFT_190599 [Serpula lacrymans var. lacrymans S7.3]|uniref:Uncharacterized protein n=2 Tax=Serpula lacrymans var. lacrymans TaxID=341189 RepID=F8QG09_SERL3|nr:uncharacterized protein SERLADRAFT_463465 [Serpula lacrymans var. lacrymans S7.9]EGN92757.1 hypothetical protein SERLA73DRAFT_190599 [Serpula lacrymans var. lacrymans S7.3]EGO26417.1 hypothetical protein SERLADRAFT_463465 [Serpula lacrymans var. lacrymans S7.9]